MKCHICHKELEDCDHDIHDPNGDVEKDGDIVLNIDCPTLLHCCGNHECEFDKQLAN